MTAPALIVNSQGTPEPPVDMQRRLGQIDPDLHLRFLAGRWALAFHWKEHDKRRELIKRGQMSPGDDFDVFGYLPLDCSVDEAFGYVVNALRSWSGTREDAKGMLERVHQWNAEQSKRNAAPVLEYADELIDANKHTLGRAMGVVGVKPVYQSEPKATKGRKRRKGKEL